MPGILQKLSYHFRMRFQDFLFKVGLAAHLHRNRPGGRVIIYHGIDERGEKKLNSRFLSEAYFEQQVKYFVEHFHVVTMKDYLAGERHPEKLTVTLSFDDGYRNNLTRALPILERYQVPATFFVTAAAAMRQDILWPDFIDLASATTDKPFKAAGHEWNKDAKGEFRNEEDVALKNFCRQVDISKVHLVMEALPYTLNFRDDEHWTDYWTLLTREELKQMAASPLVSFGTHGLLHLDWAHADRYWTLEALKLSKVWLEEIVGEELNTMAFPFGNYTRENVEDAKALGYEHLLAVNYRHAADKEDPAVVERFGINPYVSWNNQLSAILRNRY